MFGTSSILGSNNNNNNNNTDEEVNMDGGATVMTEATSATKSWFASFDTGRGAMGRSSSVRSLSELFKGFADEEASVVSTRSSRTSSRPKKKRSNNKSSKRQPSQLESMLLGLTEENHDEDEEHNGGQSSAKSKKSKKKRANKEKKRTKKRGDDDVMEKDHSEDVALPTTRREMSPPLSTTLHEEDGVGHRAQQSSSSDEFETKTSPKPPPKQNHHQPYRPPVSPSDVDHYFKETFAVPDDDSDESPIEIQKKESPRQAKAMKSAQFPEHRQEGDDYFQEDGFVGVMMSTVSAATTTQSLSQDSFSSIKLSDDEKGDDTRKSYAEVQVTKTLSPSSQQEPNVPIQRVDNSRKNVAQSLLLAEDDEDDDGFERIEGHSELSHSLLQTEDKKQGQDVVDSKSRKTQKQRPKEDTENGGHHHHSQGKSIEGSSINHQNHGSSSKKTSSSRSKESQTDQQLLDQAGKESQIGSLGRFMSRSFRNLTSDLTEEADALSVKSEHQRRRKVEKAMRKSKRDKKKRDAAKRAKATAATAAEEDNNKSESQADAEGSPYEDEETHFVNGDDHVESIKISSTKKHKSSKKKKQEKQQPVSTAPMTYMRSFGFALTNESVPTHESLAAHLGRNDDNEEVRIREADADEMSFVAAQSRRSSTELKGPLKSSLKKSLDTSIKSNGDETDKSNGDETEVADGEGEVNTSTIEVSQRSASSVSFGSVESRPFNLVVGDNPSCSDWLPISLGWVYGESSTTSVDDHVELREKRVLARPPTPKEEVLCRRLKWHERRALLMNGFGYNDKELRQEELAFAEANGRVKQSRLKGAKDWLAQKNGERSSRSTTSLFKSVSKPHVGGSDSTRSVFKSTSSLTTPASLIAKAATVSPATSASSMKSTSVGGLVNRTEASRTTEHEEDNTIPVSAAALEEPVVVKEKEDVIAAQGLNRTAPAQDSAETNTDSTIKNENAEQQGQISTPQDLIAEPAKPSSPVENLSVEEKVKENHTLKEDEKDSSTAQVAGYEDAETNES